MKNQSNFDLGNSCGSDSSCCGLFALPIILIVIGILALLHTTGMIDIHMDKWWPLVLIIVGVAKLFCRMKKNCH